jgi:hypothetical protein
MYFNTRQSTMGYLLYISTADLCKLSWFLRVGSLIFKLPLICRHLVASAGKKKLLQISTNAGAIVCDAA